MTTLAPGLTTTTRRNAEGVAENVVVARVATDKDAQAVVLTAIDDSDTLRPVGVDADGKLLVSVIERVLRTADWYAEASGNLSPLMLDRGPQRLHADRATNQAGLASAGVQTDQLWTGKALIGRLERTPPTWFTDMDVRWRGHLLPERPVSSGGWAEVFNSTVNDANVWDYLEPAMITDNGAAGDTGTVTIGTDWTPTGGAAASDELTYPSARGHDGGAGSHEGPVLANPYDDRTYRLSAVASTGVFKAWQHNDVDGDPADLTDAHWTQIDTETFGATSFKTPAGGRKLAVGPFGHYMVLRHAVMLSGVNGSVIAEYDADDNTTHSGWTPDGGLSGGVLMDAPTKPFFWTSGGAAYKISSPDLLDMPTDQGWSLTVEAQMFPANGALMARNGDAVAGAIFGGPAAAGFTLVYAPGFGLSPPLFAVCDGTNDPVICSFDPSSADGDRHSLAVVLDRVAGELRTYVDGTLSNTEDASGLDAVASSDPMGVGGPNLWFDHPALYRRALTQAEITALVAEA